MAAVVGAGLAAVFCGRSKLVYAPRIAPNRLKNVCFLQGRDDGHDLETGWSVRLDAPSEEGRLGAVARHDPSPAHAPSPFAEGLGDLVHEGLGQVGERLSAILSKRRGAPVSDPPPRAGEVAAPLPDRTDARLVFIGRLRTPWLQREDCPRQGDRDAGPLCRVELDPHWREALHGIGAHTHLQLLYWMDQARRDLVLQRPHDGEPRGTFALRSPVRPNPIASSVVRLETVEGSTLLVRGLDCVDGTPLLDIKPERCPAA
jgi:tRNA-Thr(GGU) m(6)t(6)A37 methyltransferase TsaA